MGLCMQLRRWVMLPKMLRIQLRHQGLDAGYTHRIGYPRNPVLIGLGIGFTHPVLDLVISYSTKISLDKMISCAIMTHVASWKPAHNIMVGEMKTILNAVFIIAILVVSMGSVFIVGSLLGR